MMGGLANKDDGQTSGLGCSGAEEGSAHVAEQTGDQVCKEIDDARTSGLGSGGVQVQVDEQMSALMWRKRKVSGDV